MGKYHLKSSKRVLTSNKCYLQKYFLMIRGGIFQISIGVLGLLYKVSCVIKPILSQIAISGRMYQLDLTMKKNSQFRRKTPQTGNFPILFTSGPKTKTF